MPPVPPRRRRARPVADGPIDSLLARTEDLAKGWLLALLEQSPLEDAPRIVAAAVVRDGPRLCDAAVRALADDADLRRLEPGGALAPLAARTGELTGADTPAAVSRAVDALQGVIWQAIRDELRQPDTELVSELAERLALVAELVRSAALERDPASFRERDVAPALQRDPATGDREPGTLLHAAPGPAPSEPLWIGALQDEILRSAGGSLSLLLTELEEAERVVAVEGGTKASATLSRFTGAVRSAVRRRDILVCEGDARAWIIARETSRLEARALAARIADAVRRSLAWRGAPLRATVGVAVLGEDGRNSAELIEAAEEARLAASARGVEVAAAGEFGENGENGER